MDASETLTQLPLDFSATMLNNIKIKNEFTKNEIKLNELNNNNNTSSSSVNMIFQQNNQQSSSAFKVVTPRKSDGKSRKKINFFSLSSSDQFVCTDKL